MRPEQFISMAAGGCTRRSKAQKLLGVTRPTAQAAINALMERGELVETTRQERNRTYYASRIFDAVYGDVEPANEP